MARQVSTAFLFSMRGRRGPQHPRGYSAAKRADAIEFLRTQACGLHFGKASAALGIDRNTLSDWWREYEASLSSQKSQAAVKKLMRELAEYLG